MRIALGLLEDPDPRWFEWPTLHAYLLAALYWVWGRVGLLLGPLPVLARLPQPRPERVSRRTWS